MRKVIDLFAGAGGLSLGASRAGFTVASAIELDAHAIASHMLNFPNSRHIQKDIMNMTGAELLSLSELQQAEVTGIIGGPPCQGFSSIGHGNVDDARNTLFVKFFQLVEEIKPLFFVAENVPGIMQEKYDSIRETAFSHVQEYTLLNPICVNGSEYGAPTTRTRYFFIGYRNDDKIEPFTVDDITNMKVSSDQKTTVRQALEGLPNAIRYYKHSSGVKKLIDDYWDKSALHSQSEFFYLRTTGMRAAGLGDAKYVQQYIRNHTVNGLLPTKHSKEVKHRYSQLAYGQQDRISKSIRLNPENFCPTLRAGTGPDKGSFQAVRPIHYDFSRVITPREAARLQGFPDWYMLPKTIWHGFRQIGNSVSPIVAEQILRPIFQKLT